MTIFPNPILETFRPLYPKLTYCIYLLNVKQINFTNYNYLYIFFVVLNILNTRLIQGMSNKINESFSKISILPQDEVIKANLAFLSDTDNRKVNLAVGLYKDDHNKSCVFNVVRKVEK